MSIMDDEALVVNKADDDDLIDLPPGFRFHPTDEEIITHYLKEKVFNSSFTATAIGEADLNKSEPWDLPKKAKMGEKEWYFFCQRDRKYPTGMRTNRATQSGYWKATGKDKEIYTRGKSNYLIGMKKTLVFYTGRAPKGEKTNWVMHEYRLDGKFSYYNLPKTPKDEWVVSRVFHKSTGIKKIPTTLGGIMTNSIGEDDYLLLDGRCSSSLPPLVDIPNYSSTSRPASSFTDCEDDFKGSNMASSANAGRLSDNYGNNYLSNFSTTTTTAGMMNNGHHQQPQSRLQLQLVDQKKYLQPPNYNYNTSNYPTTLATPNAIFRSHVPLQNPSNFPFQSAPFNPDHLYQKEKTSTTDFKVEQLSSSNQSQTMAVSLASQDTGLSTDINTAEISSSVVSKHEIGGSNRSSYGNLEGPLLFDPMADFSCLWDY